MSDILNKFFALQKQTRKLKQTIKLFYVFDDYMGKNYIYLTSDEKCYAFGYNYFGCLGFGHKEFMGEPTQLPELSNKSINQFYKGYNFMFALTNTKELYAWGQNDCGQLGLGYESGQQEYLSPTKNEYLSGKNLMMICCGHKHVIALSADGDVYGWGGNKQGQVGCGLDNAIINTPTKLISLSSEIFIKSIACGDYHSMALTADNFLFAFGNNDYGQFGNGDLVGSNLPKLVVNLNGLSIRKIVCSKNSTYFLTNDNCVYYCGENYVQDNSKELKTPKKLITESSLVDLISITPSFLCLAKTNNCVYELMKNELTFVESSCKNFDEYFIQNFYTTYKTLKNIDRNSDNTNDEVIENCLIDHLKLFPLNLRNVIKCLYVFDDNEGKNCIYVTKDDEVYAFGSNNGGILGIGDNGPIEHPVLIRQLCDQKITYFYHGTGFMFARNSRNEVYCWGKNKLGELGLGFECDFCQPTVNKFLSQANIVDISCGANHALALTANDDVYGWGSNEWGQVGCGSVDKCITVPLKLQIYIRIKQVSCGDNHSMVLTSRGSVYSWGKNDYGQLGHFESVHEIEPSSILQLNVKRICCNQQNSYLLTNEGHVNAYGQVVTSETTIKLPGNSLMTDINATSNGLIVARCGDTIYELKRSEQPLVKTEYDTFNKYLADKYSITFTTICAQKYQTIKKLGSGIYGTVYKCRDVIENKLVSLREINSKGLTNEQTSGILSEVESLLKLDCLYLVKYQKTWLEKNAIIIKTDYYDYNLFEVILLKDQAFNRSTDESLDFVEIYLSTELFKDIVSGIEFLHSLNPPLIHKNLKTTNVMISHSKDCPMVAKVTDYGFSEFYDLGIEPNKEFAAISKYTALEIIKGRKYGLNADIYSMGLIAEEIFEIDVYSTKTDLIEENTSTNEIHQRISELVFSMQTSPQWWQRPGCAEILASIEEIFNNSSTLLNSEYNEHVIDSLKQARISFFYDFLASRLRI